MVKCAHEDDTRMVEVPLHKLKIVLLHLPSAQQVNKQAKRNIMTCANRLFRNWL